MATIRYDAQADLGLIKSKQVAIVGYGSQGHAHALNLKDSGVQVCVGLHQTSKSRDKVRQAGLEVLGVREAAEKSDVIMILAPDTAQPALYQEHIAPVLK